MEKVLLKCSYSTFLIFFKIISYNIVRDRFEKDSVKVMKIRPLVVNKQWKFQYTLAWLSLTENHENCY